MGDRREQTTAIIRDALVRELLERGHAALTMEGVAKRSYSSVGGVYARYPNKSAALADVATSVVGSYLDSLGWAAPQGLAPAMLFRAVVGDPRGAEAMHALVELSLASRHDAALVGPVKDLVARTRLLVGVEATTPELASAMRWFVLATLFGNYVLTGAGCTVAPVWPEFARFIDRVVDTDASPARRGHRPATTPEVQIPPSPQPRADDPLADSLADATRGALARGGMSGARLKQIAEASGVTTGAVYRRYRSKGEMVNDALVRELDQSRYGWTLDFVSSLIDPESARSAGDVLAGELAAMLGDEARVLTTLEMIAAARLDPDVRETLSGQVHRAAATRARMFSDLRDAGVLVGDADPELLGWLIQLVPSGGRVLAAIGEPLESENLRISINAVVDAIV